MHRVAGLLILPALPVAALRAQSLQGTVVDSALQRPIAGAVVLVLDASGASVARTVANVRGQYQLPLPAHAVRVRVLHIGFRPSTVELPLPLPLPLPLRGVVRVNVSLALLRTVLEAVTVRDNASCAVRPDRAHAMALWEQARQGLLAMIVARDAIPAQLKRLRFQRRMDGTSDRVLSQDVQVDSTTGAARPFQAAHSAAEFIQRGFVADSAGVRSYFAPDADVLLEDAFFLGYCFRVMPADRAHAGLVGVGFAAAKPQAPKVDIDGAFWMDTSARVLTSIEFRYVGLDARLQMYRPGGRVEFREMPNGIVLIDRWTLRMIAGRSDTAFVVRDAPMRRGRDVVPEVRTRFEALESGGELAHASWQDSTSWHASLGTLRIDARTHAGAPAVGADISLEHSDYRARVDAHGVLVFADVLPGPYRVIVHDTLLAQIDIAVNTPIEFRAVRDSVHAVTLAVPTAYDYARSVCPEPRTRLATPVAFFVYVTTSAGEPARGVEMWDAILRAREVPSFNPEAHGGKADTSGRYASCWRYGLGDTMQIWVRRADGLPRLTRKTMTEPVNAVRIVLPPNE